MTAGLLSRRLPWLTLGLVVALVYAFIFAPILITAMVSFNGVSKSSFPPEGFSLRWWAEAFDPRWWNPLVFSVKQAALSALAATILGTLLAFGVVRHRFRGRSLILALSTGPLVLPALITGIGLLQMLRLAGLGSLLGLPGLVIGHAVVCLPFTLRTTAISLAAMPPQVERAALSLGARPWIVFREITLPLIKDGVFAGAAFSFIQSFTDYSMGLFLSDAAAKPIPIVILNYIEFGFTPTIAAVAVITMLVPLILVFAVQRAFRIGDFIYGEGARG